MIKMNNSVNYNFTVGSIEDLKDETILETISQSITESIKRAFKDMKALKETQDEMGMPDQPFTIINGGLLTINVANKPKQEEK